MKILANPVFTIPKMQSVYGIHLCITNALQISLYYVHSSCSLHFCQVYQARSIGRCRTMDCEDLFGTILLDCDDKIKEKETTINTSTTATHAKSSTHVLYALSFL